MTRVQSHLVLVSSLLTLGLLGVLTRGLKGPLEEMVNHLSYYNLHRTGELVGSIRSQIEAVIVNAQQIHEQLKKLKSQTQKEFSFYSKIDFESLYANKVNKGIIFRFNSEHQLRKLVSFGDSDEALLTSIKQLKWNVDRFLNEPILIAKVSEGMMALGICLPDDNQEGSLFIFQLQPQLIAQEPSFMETESELLAEEQRATYLVDGFGEVILADEPRKMENFSSEAFEKIQELIYYHKNGSSSEDIKNKGNYRNIFKKELYWTAYDCRILTTGFLNSFLTLYHWKMTSDEDEADLSLDSLNSKNWSLKKLCVFSVLSAKKTAGIGFWFLFRCLMIFLGILLFLGGIWILYRQKLSQKFLTLQAWSKNLVETGKINPIQTLDAHHEALSWIVKAFDVLIAKHEQMKLVIQSEVWEESMKERVSFFKNHLLPQSEIYLSEVNAQLQTSQLWTSDYQLAVGGSCIAEGLRHQEDYYFYSPYSGGVLGLIGKVARPSPLGWVVFAALKAGVMSYLELVSSVDLNSLAGLLNQICYAYFSGENGFEGQLLNLNVQLGKSELLNLTQGAVYQVKGNQGFERLKVKSGNFLGSTQLWDQKTESYPLEAGLALLWFSPGFEKRLNELVGPLGLEKFFSFFEKQYETSEGQLDKLMESVVSWFYEVYGGGDPTRFNGLSLIMALVGGKGSWDEEEVEKEIESSETLADSSTQPTE